VFEAGAVRGAAIHNLSPTVDCRLLLTDLDLIYLEVVIEAEAAKLWPTPQGRAA
jgi:hypothetical protein